MGPGKVFGEWGIVERDEASDGVATEAVEALAIALTVIDKMLDNDAKCGRRLLSMMGRRRAIAERRMTLENRRLRALVERRLTPDSFEAVEAELTDLRGRVPASANGSAEGAALRRLAGESSDGGPTPLREAQRRFEIAYVKDLLARTGGNVAAAARLAGISRPNFHKKLKSLGVDANEFKQAARRGRLHSL